MFRIIATAGAIAACSLVAVPAYADHHHHDDRVYGDDGRSYDHYRHHDRDHRCRDSGTGGLIIGGVAGGFAGNAIAGHGDKTLGTVIGAGGGALLGNSIGKSGHHNC